MQFGTDGVRGRANTELTASFALDLGRAAARVLGASTAVVGGDSRISTPMLEAAFVAGLSSEGVEADPARRGADGGDRVRSRPAGRDGRGRLASHNPYEDNGIKLFAVGGTKLPDELEQRIELALAASAGARGRTGCPCTGVAISAVTSTISSACWSGRDLRGLRVVVDAANGAASHVAGDVFGRAGAQVVVINADPDGRNINAGCGATNPAGLQAAR